MHEKRFGVNFDAKAEAYMFFLYMCYGAKTREQKEAAVKVWNHNCGAKMIEKEKEGGGEDGDIA